MEKTIGQPKKVKTKSGRVGSFFLGTFIGFLLTIALLAGAFSFVYFKVSPNWINRHFHAGINLPYDLDSMTLNDFVSAAINLGKDLDNYTLAKLEKDFGIELKDEIANINISQLKNTPFTQLADEVMDKFGNISAYELNGILTLPKNISDILSDTTTYYVNGTRLYKDAAHNNEVQFKYEIKNGKVFIKNLEVVERNIKPDSSVDIELELLPLKIAFESLTDSISSDLTIGELRHDYDLSIPDYLHDDVKVNEIAAAIQEVEIGEILGIQNPTGIMAKIATAKVSELNQDFINSLTVKDIFPEMYEDGSEKGVLSLIPEETTLTNIPSAISDKVEKSTLNELNDAGLLGSGIDFLDKYIPGTSQTLGSLTINELIKALNNSNLLQDRPIGG